jgi:signal transduction histidine kinase
MTPEMHAAIAELSVFFHPDPNVVCRRVVEIVGQFYPKATAMINLMEGRRVVLREVVNLHPAMQGLNWLPLNRTYCVFALRSSAPLLIQDAAKHPDCCTNRAVAFGLRRYLGVPIRSSNGDSIGTLCFLDDCIEEELGESDVQFLTILAMRVSAERERERIINERIAEHRRVAERMAELNAQLKAAAEDKRRFVSMIIHDLRHPLTTLKTVSYLLQNETDPQQVSEHYALIENRIAALSTLLEELVRYNALDANEQPALQWEEVAVDPLIRDCVEGFQPAYRAQSLQLVYSPDPAVNNVRTDRALLTHILLNLLSNALKYTAEGGVTVRTICDAPSHWLLEVSDTGTGISPEACDQIYDEGFREPANAARTTGFGLGLAIVRRLCDALDAELMCDSTPGVGTSFRIKFPLASQTLPPSPPTQ